MMSRAQSVFLLFGMALAWVGCARVAGNYPNRGNDESKPWIGALFETEYEDKNLKIRIGREKIPVEEFRDVERALLARKKATLPLSEFKRFKKAYHSRNPVSAIMKDDIDHQYYKMQIQYKTKAKAILGNGFVLFAFPNRDTQVIRPDEGHLVSKKGNASGFKNGLESDIVIDWSFNSRLAGEWDQAYVRVRAFGEVKSVGFDPSKLITQKAN